MSARRNRWFSYLRLVRLFPLLWGLGTWVFPSYIALREPSFPLWVRFTGASLLLPFSVGLLLSCFPEQVFHLAFFQLLPGARRFFRRAQVIVFAVAAVGLVAAMHRYDPALPLAAALGFAVAGLSIALPCDMQFKWHGSSRLAFTWFVLVLLFGWQAGAIRSFALESPWAILALGCAVAGLNFQLSFNRERLREKALSPHLSPLTILSRGSSRGIQAQARVNLARSRAVGRDWPRGPVGDSTWSWRRVFWHDHFGANPHYAGFKIFGILLLIYGSLALIGVAGYLYAKNVPVTVLSIARVFHAGIWMTGPNGAPLAPFVAAIVSVMIYAATLTHPKPYRLYPLSRERFAGIAARMSVVHWLQTFVGVGAGVLAVSWAICWPADVAFAFRAIPLFALPVLLLPLMPLLAWGALPQARSGGGINPLFGSFTRISYLGLICVSTMGITLLSLYAPEIFTGLGLTTIVAVTALTGWFYLARLKALYLRSDLVSRSGS